MGGQEAVDRVGRSQTYCVFIDLFLAGAGRHLGPQQVSATTRHSPLCSPNRGGDAALTQKYLEYFPRTA